MKTNLISVILLLLLLLNCTFKVNETQKNRGVDLEEATVVSEEFYKYQHENKIDDMIQMFCADSIKDVNELKDRLNKYKEQFGSVQTKLLKHSESNVTKGTDPSARYLLIYNNSYQELNTVETIRMSMEKSGRISITDYKVELR